MKMKVLRRKTGSRQGHKVWRSLRARFNEFIVSKLISGAAGRRWSATAWSTERHHALPGFRARSRSRWQRSKLAQSGKYDAVICLGAVIRGCDEPLRARCAARRAKGIAQVGLQTGVPVHVRRPDHREHRAGDRACRHEGGQQGRRRGDGGAGAGQSAAADLTRKGDAVPLRRAPVPEKPGAITPSPLHSRGGSGHVSRGRGVKVRQSWTFMGIFTRRSAERLSYLFCRRQNAAGDCARRGAKRHASGVPFPLFSRCFLFILTCLFLYIMYIPVALYEL